MIHNTFLTMTLVYLFVSVYISIFCGIVQQEGGIRTVCMDANFGLVRKVHSGCSTIPPLMYNNFFMNNDDVDGFVNAYANDHYKVR